MELVRKSLALYNLSSTTVDWIMSSRTSEQWQVFYDNCKKHAEERQVDVEKVVFASAIMSVTQDA